MATAMEPVTDDFLRNQVKKLTNELEEARARFETIAGERIETARELQAAIDQIEVACQLVRSVNDYIRNVRTASGERGALNRDIAEVLCYIEMPILVVDQALRVRGFSNGAALKLNLEPACLGKRLEELMEIKNFDPLRSESVLGELDLPAGGHLYAMRIQRRSTNDPYGDLVLLIDLKKNAESLVPKASTL